MYDLCLSLILKYIHLYMYILHTYIVEMFAIYIAKNILQIFFGYVFYMSHFFDQSLYWPGVFITQAFV